jgi:hypothetical protein
MRSVVVVVLVLGTGFFIVARGKRGDGEAERLARVEEALKATSARLAAVEAQLTFARTAPQSAHFAEPSAPPPSSTQGAPSANEIDALVEEALARHERKEKDETWERRFGATMKLYKANADQTARAREICQAWLGQAAERHAKPYYEITEEESKQESNDIKRADSDLAEVLGLPEPDGLHYNCL